jgi:MraZ protein
LSNYFINSALHKLDAKGRVSLPSDFRDILKASASAETFVLVPKSDDVACHIAYARPTHDALIEDIEGTEFDSEDEEDATRSRYIWSARAISLEEGGRFVLTREEREALGLDGQVYFKGNGMIFEIWNPETHARLKPGTGAKARSMKPRIGARP